MLYDDLELWDEVGEGGSREDIGLFIAGSVACWAPTDVGSSSFSVLAFCLFILFMGFSR